MVIEKRAQLDRILQACLGLEVETVIPQAEIVPGETMKMRHAAMVRSSVPIRWLGVRYLVISSGITNAVESASQPPGGAGFGEVYCPPTHR